VLTILGGHMFSAVTGEPWTDVLRTELEFYLRERLTVDD